MVRVIALKNISHNHVDYLAGSEIPAELFGIRRTVTDGEFSELELLIEQGAVRVEQKEMVAPFQKEEAIVSEKPKRGKKAKE